MNFLDAARAPLANVRLTNEGYLVADAFAVRTGIQIYHGSELGRPDLDIVRVYRAPDEVFSKDSVSSFAHKPITLDHPPGGVDAASWRETAVGEISTEAMRDGERLRLQLVVKDKRGVDEVQDGIRRQLSAGYSCRIDWTPGVTDSGEHFDASQKDIRINHVAIVKEGRAGNCAIGDSAWGIAPVDNLGDSPRNPTEDQMVNKPIVLGGRAVQVLVEDAAVIEAFVADLETKLSTATANLETLQGEKLATDQKLADSVMTPAKLQQLVADRAVVASGYKALTGKDAPTDMADADLRRNAVVAKLGDEAVKALSDEAVAGAFRAFTAGVKPIDPLQVVASDGILTNDAAAQDHSAVFAVSGVKMKKG